MTETELPETVSVVYATRDHQPMVTLKFEAGLTALGAVELSGLLARFPEIDAGSLSLGVFGTLVGHEHRLEPGDRVEICRPLEVDPREMRRELLASGKVMGGRAKKSVQG